MSVFHANDVRAIYPDDLDENLVAAIGRATAIFLKAKKLIVGRDGRNSSPQLHKALIEGLIKEGIGVIDIGLCTSPMFYFAIVQEDAEGGLMVTASHNPLEYNGLKINGKMAKPINIDIGLLEIEQLAAQKK